MSSYFEIFLDTTSPSLSLTMPPRTIPQNVIEIEIKSNEELSTYQEIYIIDSSGERHNYIFNKIDDFTYYGLVAFQSYPFGIATLYARLKDDVFNPSEMYSKPINVAYLPNRIECFISFHEREAEIDIIERDNNINVYEHENSLNYIERNKKVETIERETILEVV